MINRTDAVATRAIGTEVLPIRAQCGQPAPTPAAVGTSATIGAAMLLLLLSGSVVQAGNPRDVVAVPDNAEAVKSLRWSDVGSITPLNRRLIVFNTPDRPYLLVLKRACPGLRADSIIVTEEEDKVFEPRKDLLRAADPTYSGTSPRVLTGDGEFNRYALTESTIRCRPDVLYAITDEGLQWVEQMIAEPK